jgi:hypothetical protein
MDNTDNHSQLRLFAFGSLSCVLAASLLASGGARADYKAFAHVYPYFTQPEGGKEIEAATSFETADLKLYAATTVIQESLEVEYGITDHWDISFYWVLSQAPAEPLVIDSYRLETRYRFVEKGVWPVDTEIYGEVERPADLSLPFELEAKVILERDVGHFFFQGNFIGEVKVATGTPFGYLLEFAGGAGYQITPGFKVGLETILDHQQDSQTLPSTNAFYLGPSLALASSSFWFVLTPAFKVAGTSLDDAIGSDLRLRFIIGIPLS